MQLYIHIQVCTPFSESSRCTRPSKIENPQKFSEFEDESDGSAISAPSYSIITMTDDNSDSAGYEQDDMTATEDIDTEECTLQQEIITEVYNKYIKRIIHLRCIRRICAAIVVMVVVVVDLW